jgi:hypothetical protein
MEANTLGIRVGSMCLCLESCYQEDVSLLSLKRIGNQDTRHEVFPTLLLLTPPSIFQKFPDSNRLDIREDIIQSLAFIQVETTTLCPQTIGSHHLFHNRLGCRYSGKHRLMAWQLTQLSSLQLLNTIISNSELITY